MFFLYQKITFIQRKKPITLIQPKKKRRNPTLNVHSLLQKLELYHFYFTIDLKRRANATDYFITQFSFFSLKIQIFYTHSNIQNC